MTALLRFTLLVLLFVNASSFLAGRKYAISVDEKFSKYLNRVFELFRNTMKTGIKKLKIPPTEPLVIDTIKIDENDPPVVIKGYIADLTVTHLSEFKITNLKANLNELYVHLTVLLPRFEVAGTYSVKGKASFFPIEGKGPVHVTGQNAKLEGMLKLEKTPIANGDQRLQCSEFKADFGVSSDGFKVDIKGLYDDDNLSSVISDIVSDNGVKVYNNFRGQAMNKLTSVVKDLLNEKLNNVTLKQILSGRV